VGGGGLTEVGRLDVQALGALLVGPPLHLPQLRLLLRQRLLRYEQRRGGGVAGAEDVVVELALVLVEQPVRVNLFCRPIGAGWGEWKACSDRDHLVAP
jgi:hypothetical protein